MADQAQNAALKMVDVKKKSTKISNEAINKSISKKVFKKHNAAIEAPIISEFLRTTCNLLYIIAVVPVGILTGITVGFEAAVTKISTMYQRHISDSKVEFNSILKK